MRARVFLLLLLLFFPGSSLASPYIVVDEPELKGAVILRDGDSFLLGQHSSVSRIHNGEATELISNIPGEISALALGDITGDLKDDLVVSTTNAGAIYFYKEQNETWSRTGEPLYLWATVLAVEVHDFNQDGWGDLVVLTDSGELQLFLSFEGKFYPFWKSAPNEKVAAWEVVDVNGDGFVDLIYTYQSGYVGILSWDEHQFTTLWENFPWGQIDSLVVLSKETKPEWLVVTSQKMVYGWRWQNDEVVITRHFYASDLGETLFRVPGQGLLSLSQKTGVSLFELKASAVAEIWRIPGVSGDKAYYLSDGTYLLSDLAKNYSRLVPGSGEWRVFIDEKEMTDLVEVVEREQLLFFNVVDLCSHLGIEVAFNDDSWHFSSDSFTAWYKVGDNWIHYLDLQIPLNDSFFEEDDSLYATAGLFSLFGWSAKSDFARKRVIFYQNWGWWLGK